MANNNIEQYLEAMLAALDGDTVPDVPSPSWNIEKYLAAILTKLSSGGGSSGGGNIEVVNVTFTEADGSYVVECDKTFADIIALIGDGKTVIAYCEDVSSDYVGTPTFVCPYYDYDLDNASIAGVGGTTDIGYGGGQMREFTFYMDAEGNSVDVLFWQKMSQ